MCPASRSIPGRNAAGPPPVPEASAATGRTWSMRSRTRRPDPKPGRRRTGGLDARPGSRPRRSFRHPCLGICRPASPESLGKGDHRPQPIRLPIGLAFRDERVVRPASSMSPGNGRPGCRPGEGVGFGGRTAGGRRRAPRLARPGRASRPRRPAPLPHSRRPGRRPGHVPDRGRPRERRPGVGRNAPPGHRLPAGRPHHRSGPGHLCPSAPEAPPTPVPAPPTRGRDAAGPARTAALASIPSVVAPVTAAVGWRRWPPSRPAWPSVGRRLWRGPGWGRRPCGRQAISATACTAGTCATSPSSAGTMSTATRRPFGSSGGPGPPSCRLRALASRGC